LVVSLVMIEGWSQKMMPPCPAPERTQPPFELPRFYMIRLTFDGVNTAAFVEVHNEIVSLSSAMEGTLLVLEAFPLLLSDFQFLYTNPPLPPYSSATKESAIYSLGM